MYTYRHRVFASKDQGCHEGQSRVAVRLPSSGASQSAVPRQQQRLGPIARKHEDPA